jgi:hypothetical protein
MALAKRSKSYMAGAKSGNEINHTEMAKARHTTNDKSKALFPKANGAHGKAHKAK